MTRLTDAQLFILSTASLRDDRGVETRGKLESESSQKSLKELIHLGLLAEVRAIGSLPVWRNDTHSGPTALRITGEGLKAIGADELIFTSGSTASGG